MLLKILGSDWKEENYPVGIKGGNHPNSSHQDWFDVAREVVAGAKNQVPMVTTTAQVSLREKLRTGIKQALRDAARVRVCPRRSRWYD